MQDTQNSTTNYAGHIPLKKFPMSQTLCTNKKLEALSQYTIHSLIL